MIYFLSIKEKKGLMVRRLRFENKVILLALCVLIVSNIFAYSIFDLRYGSEVPHHDARVAALGGTGVAGGFTLMDASINPANMYFLGDKYGAQFTYSLIKNSENRALPLWNFFDSYIDESTFARNESFYNEVSVGAFYGLPLGDSKLSFAFLYRPVMNFGADYYEEMRNDQSSDMDSYPPIIAKNFIESEGLLNSYNLLLNWGMPVCFGRIVDDCIISFGTEISFLKGEHKYDTRIHWTELAHERAGAGVLPDSLYKYQNKIDGVSFKFGLNSQLNQRVRLGFAYTPKATLNQDASFVTVKSANSDDFRNLPDKSKIETGDFILPTKYRFGVLFQPRNPFKTNFHVDFELIQNSEINKFFDNGYAFHVGMEHYVGRAVPMRLGFSHQTAKQDRGIALPSVSLGTSFPVMQNLQLDLAGTYGKRDYIAILFGNIALTQDKNQEKEDKK